MDIWECALGFMDSQVLLTAEELGVFDALDRGPNHAAEVAAAAGLPRDSAARLLTALCALGLIERLPDGRYINGTEASEKLVRGRPGYIGSMFRHVKDELYPVWGHLREALAEGAPQWRRAFDGGGAPTEQMYEDPERLRQFMAGMHAITYQSGTELAWAAVPELDRVRTVVDVGGASGAFLIALAQRFPGLRGTVFDLQPVRPIAEEFFHSHGLANRLRFEEGDFWEDPLPAGADAYALGFVLHDWDREGGSRILAKVADAAPPGSLLIVGESLLNDEGTGPLYVARMDLNMLVAARGRERSAREYAEWLGAFGFELLRIHPTSTGKDFMITRRRAAARAADGTEKKRAP